MGRMVASARCEQSVAKILTAVRPEALSPGLSSAWSCAPMPVSDTELTTLAAGHDLITLGMHADEARRACHGAGTTFVRVAMPEVYPFTQGELNTRSPVCSLRSLVSLSRLRHTTHRCQEQAAVRGRVWCSTACARHTARWVGGAEPEDSARMRKIP